MTDPMTGFGHLLHAEWTKLRTVRGWAIALLGGLAAIIGFGLLPGMHGSCGSNGPASDCTVPIGPDGQQVTDSFYFVHQPLTGDGSITVRVTSLTGLLPAPGSDPRGPIGTRPGLVPWAKAGLIATASTSPGSAYTAVMVTGSHGVRMQTDYTHDTAGPPGDVSPAAARWLRLTRTRSTFLASASTDGTHWTTIGTADLTGLPSTVQVGLFATAPQYNQAVHQGILNGDESGPAQATASFDHLSRQGTWAGGAWTGQDVGGQANPLGPLGNGSYGQHGGGFTVTGSGDIAPAVSGSAGVGVPVSQTLAGTFVGLIVVIVVGTGFVTAEYRRGLIRTTLTASPRRGPVLVAKALVIGAVTFCLGLTAAAVVVTFGPRILRDNGVYVYPVGTGTELRLICGTAALLAVAAVLAVAIGALARRSASAVSAVVVLLVLPYLLAMSFLPLAAGQWLLRVTPAAAFAVQQSAVRYPQVDNIYSPADGYFPLTPWTGLAVLTGWAALALGLALYLFRRRDA